MSWGEAQYVLFSIPLEKKDVKKIFVQNTSAGLKQRTFFFSPRNDVKLWTRIERGSGEEESTARTLFAPFFSL